MMRICLVGLCVGLFAACDGKSGDDPDGDSGGSAPAPPVGVDADEDGYVANTDGGDDCDDTDPTVHPGATEIWYDGVDTDCDGSSDYDADADGYDAADHGGDDCDDADPATYPGAVETWDDGVDQDCDGTVDRASSACVAEFTFRTPSGEATIDGCQEWSLNAAFEFDPDDVPEVRAFQLSFDGSTEAEFECSVSLVQDHVCGTAYYRQGDTEAGRTEVVTLDCTGVADEDETSFSGVGYLHLTSIDTGATTGSFAGEPLYTALEGTLAVVSGDYTLRGDFMVGAVQLAGDGEEQLDCAGSDGDVDDDGSLDVFYDGDDCDDTDPLTGPGFAPNDSTSDCMRDADADDWGDLFVTAPGVVPGTDCADDDPAVHPTAASMEPDLCTVDADGDGWGAAAAEAPIEAGTDCDDAEAATFPGAATEATGGECMLDVDGDGYGDMTATGLYDVGTDCNDADAAEYPGAVTEATGGECMRDADGDGYGDAGAEGLYDVGTDCNDGDVAEYPGAVTEATGGECMRDADGDGYGDAGAAGLYDVGTDCNDGDVAEYPGAVTEATGGECMRDADGDGYGDAGAEGLYDAGTDCNDGDVAEYPGAVTEATGGECMTDRDGDGFGDLLAGGLYDVGTDCDDDSADTHPGAASLEPSLCTYDRDGDGYGAQQVSSPVQAGTDCDDDVATTYVGVATLETYGGWTCMADADGDGYGDLEAIWPVRSGEDCDDTSAATYPGAASLETSLCTLDADGDGYGDDSLAAPIDAGSDCDDGDAAVHPDVLGMDWLDGVDINCDGQENYNDISGGSIPHTVIRATASWSEAGQFLSFGDVNGDGHVDMHAGSGLCSVGGWVVNGPMSSWPADFDAADTTYEADTRWIGCRGSNSGALGDVDDDGFDDFVVVDWGSSTEVNAGYVFSGPLSTTVDATVADLTITKGDPSTCQPNGRGFGADDDQDSILIDDLDGDGDDDLVFGSPLWWIPCTTGNHYKGAVFVFEGPLSASLDADDADVTWIGDTTDGYVGHRLEILTDINGDGSNDLAVTQLMFPSALYVYYDPLAHSGGSVPDEADETLLDYAAVSARMGDHNGDGYGDIAVLDGGYSAFEIDIYEGSPAGLGTSVASTVFLDTGQSWPFRGDGDFNADGYDDLVVGGFLLTGPLSGAFDAEDEALAVFDVDDLTFGERSVALQDMNGDGYAELLMGSRADSVLETWSGGVYVLPGQ